ncbi:MAG: DNA-3-methyladenine glycosylase 2 family protein [Anaerolineales bacterium]|nr:DNA-3-methyladenine glycosylase 2 family protein [Anaerolineales bacterium]
MTKLKLSARQPFSFHHTVCSHGWYQLPPFVYEEEAGRLEYLLCLSNGRVVDLTARGVAGGVSVEVTGELSSEERSEVRRVVAWVFDLDRDLSAFYAAIRREPKLAHVAQKACGRVLRSATFFEDVVKTILTTNTLWAATIRMTANLVGQFGDPLPGDTSRRAFPTPQRLAAVPVEVLKEETRLGYRAPYIRELAERAASGDLEIEAFKTCSLPTLELRKELLKIKGVGAYAAANLLMILGRSDFIPLDSWALKSVSNEWHDGQPVEFSDVEAAFEQWGTWKGLVYWVWDWKG